MPDMYDKLGEMLNEALESGKIPQNKTTKTESEDSGPVHCQRDEASDSSISNRNSRKKTLKSEKKQQIPTGEVIKLHKYTYNMQFPPQIQNALTTLDMVYSFTQKDITAAYHNKLKEIHPDTQNTIQTSQTVQNIRQITVDDIRNSYQLLCNFFGIKK